MIYFFVEEAKLAI